MQIKQQFKYYKHYQVYLDKQLNQINSLTKK